MLKRNLISLAMGALLVGGALSAQATSATNVGQATADVAKAAQSSQQDAGFTANALSDVIAAKGSGRGKPRVPGGSGCDDPEDLIEHPECAGNAPVTDDQLARRKPRVPGGSGCDDPEDVIEHPECRLGNAMLDKTFVAREASEGPRGADNERPGDRQRRGGRG